MRSAFPAHLKPPRVERIMEFFIMQWRRRSHVRIILEALFSDCKDENRTIYLPLLEITFKDRSHSKI
jgi:hypothetical protein